jgi:uncharacterized protein YbaP (TraB family)
MRWLCLLLLLTVNSVYAASSVWVVSKGANKLYIGGTVHVLAQSDYPLPAEYEQAYSKSDQLVFETNIKDAAGPQFQQQMLERMIYPKGETLHDNLGSSAFKGLTNYCAAQNIPLANLEHMRPQMVVLALTSIALQRIGMVSAGVDQYFYQRAQKDKKPIQYFETTTQQLDYLVNMGKGHEDQLVLNTIRDLDDVNTMMGEMKSAWRTGNQKKFERVAIDPMKKDYPDLYQELLVNRNKAWLGYIEKMLKTSDVEFILVGALHLVGPDGVLQQLQARGYQVSRFK